MLVSPPSEFPLLFTVMPDKVALTSPFTNTPFSLAVVEEIVSLFKLVSSVISFIAVYEISLLFPFMPPFGSCVPLPSCAVFSFRKTLFVKYVCKNVSAIVTAIVAIMKITIFIPFYN